LKLKKITIALIFIGIAGFIYADFQADSKPTSTTKSDPRILQHTVDPHSTDLKMFWKNEKDTRYKNAQGLKSELDSLGKTLKFCVNAGMFNPKFAPAGLYIENGVKIKEINRVEKAKGNFHLVPNGVFLIKDDRSCQVIQTSEYKSDKNVNFATQSGPMLIINGAYHPKFNEGSSNLNIRNGVGILPNGHVLFAMSTEPINFYDFATFFKINGCENALYLDGVISRTYLPEKGALDLKGNFGVLIGEVD